MIKYVILIIWVLTAQLSYCQGSYPKKLLIEGDTVVAITVDQAKKVNKAFISAGHYKEISDSLNVKIDVLEQKAVNNSFIIAKKDTIIKEWKEIVDLQYQAQAKVEKEYIAVNVKYINSKKWGRIKNQALGVSVIVTLLVLLVK